MSDFLPTFNACCNTLSAVLLFSGYRAIKRGKRQLHARLMGSALLTSCLFLAGYITRLTLHGTTKLSRRWTRHLSHDPRDAHRACRQPDRMLVPLTLVRALKSNFEAHKRVARITLPIWLYVSMTGVVIYVFLYT